MTACWEMLPLEMRHMITSAVISAHSEDLATCSEFTKRHVCMNAMIKTIRVLAPNDHLAPLGAYLIKLNGLLQAAIETEKAAEAKEEVTVLQIARLTGLSVEAIREHRAHKDDIRFRPSGVDVAYDDRHNKEIALRWMKWAYAICEKACCTLCSRSRRLST